MAILRNVGYVEKSQRLRITVSEKLQNMGFDYIKSNRAANLIVNALETDRDDPTSRALESVLSYEGISARQLRLHELI